VELHAGKNFMVEEKKMEALCSSRTLASTGCHNPGDSMNGDIYFEMEIKSDSFHCE